MNSRHDAHDGVRTPEHVFRDHLRLGLAGTAEEDLGRNYAEDVVALTSGGVFRGHDGIRELSRLLREQLPNCSFRYRTQLVEGDLAFLEWTATSDLGEVRDGADSYVIRDGRIVAQTIHYTIEP